MEKMVKTKDTDTGIIDLTDEGFASICKSLFIDDTVPYPMINMKFSYGNSIFVVRQENDDIYFDIIS